jgi:selenocysteine-specific elongation factor
VKVIGTAGHIDHGKSTLVQRLTGIDPDRFAEEKRRGMTIDLGFAWLRLPGGDEVSIVDVPGHERFVKNMLAGAGGIDIALLVVAADEGVMPQTREHVDILDLLGVETAVVALTKCDLVDAEWLALVSDDVERLLAKTGLAGAPMVPVSAVTGEGSDDLLRALDQAIRAGPDRADVAVPWLPVDRSFTVDGFGTVVTGTLSGGSLATGDEVELLPSGLRARIRSVQTHGHSVETVGPGDRAALNLAGIDRAAVRRGDMVALPGTVSALRRFDARIRVLQDAPAPMRHGVGITLHLGAAERAVTVSLLDAEEIGPGHDGWVQIRSSEPVVVLPGQRFILRLPAPARTVAGGTVVALRPRHRRRDPAAIERLDTLFYGTPREAIHAACDAVRPLRLTDVVAASGQSPAAVRACVDELVRDGEIVTFGDWIATRGRWSAAAERVTGLLARYHESFPLRDGMPLEEARSRLRWPRESWADVVRALANTGLVRQQGATLAMATFAAARAEDAARDAVIATLMGDRFAPPGAADLLALPGVTREVLGAMVRDRTIRRLDDGLYVAGEAYNEMLAWVLDTLRDGGSVSIASVRDRFGTSRRYAQALLEYLDSERITRRVGDERTLGSRASACV